MKTNFRRAAASAVLILSLIFGGAARAAAVGEAAPAFSLPDPGGRAVSLADYKGQVVVLEWVNPDCPFVQRHYAAGTMKKLAEAYAGRGVVWLAVNSTHYMDAASNRKWIEKYGLPYPILDDRAGAVGHLYGARTTPHMFVIDKNGKIVYAGAIDSDAGGGADSVNYVGQALDALLAGKSVATAETKPYGCSVKYAK